MDEKEDRAVPTLQQSAETAAFKSLGEVADKLCNPFCCGGMLKGQNILLHYKSKEGGKLREIKLPGAKKEDMKQLLSAGSVASFGKGCEQITDLNYRNAFKLDPDEITTSFNPCSTSILSEIETTMVPNRHIRAEFYKLNMYTGPGCHFKSHVDTPCSEDMFGSLVVCLPTQFTGGALVTRHKGEEKVFDWSSPTEDPLNVVCWAAFFSDVEHEILPVTSGYRLTLTYNLYFVKESGSISMSFVSQFHTTLKEVLYSPQFLPSGGCLGFDCKHAYVFSSLNKTELLPHLLKGADYAVFSAAKSLGLKVSVKPLIEGEERWYVLPQFSHKIGIFRNKGEGDAGRFYGCFSQSNRCEDGLQSFEWEMLDSVYNKLPIEIQPGDISRCTQPSWKDVFKFITSPIQATPELLDEIMELPKLLEEKKMSQGRVLFDHSRKLNKELSDNDFTVISSAIHEYHRHRGQLFGVYTHYGNEAADIELFYQSAVILVELPAWGEAPRTLATTELEQSAECELPKKKERPCSKGITDSSKIYSWKKDA